jgi:hypothetical protein
VKTCSCHQPPRQATHYVPHSGHLLCAESAARITAALAFLVSRRTPEPIGAPSLFSEEHR